MQIEQISQATLNKYAKNSDEAENMVKNSEKAVQTVAQEESQTRNTGFQSIAQPIEKLLKSVGVELKFNIHEDTGEVQAEVRDSSGEKVIRKIPPDEQLDLAASIKELSSVFLNRQL